MFTSVADCGKTLLILFHLLKHHEPNTDCAGTTSHTLTVGRLQCVSFAETAQFGFSAYTHTLTVGRLHCVSFAETAQFGFSL